jgi:uncharacterized membrane protein YfcA
VASWLVVGVMAMVAASAQTISGFGMNLILAPAAQLALPGAAAVRLVVGAGAILNSGLLATGWRSILWRAVLYLAVPALGATALLGPVISHAGERPVSAVVAAVTLLAAVTSAAGALPARFTGRAGALIAGALAGALNVSSGVSGPPVAVYAAAQPWPARQLVATVQAVFLPINVAAFIVLRAVPLTPGIFAAGAAGTGAGLLAGTYLRDRIPAALVRVAVLIVAAVGAVLILVRAFS